MQSAGIYKTADRAHVIRLVFIWRGVVSTLTAGINMAAGLLMVVVDAITPIV